MNIGIIGCGYIGKKRAESIKEPHQLVAVCDINEDNARKLCNGKSDIFVTTDYIIRGSAWEACYRRKTCRYCS